MEPGTREGIIPSYGTYFSEVTTIGHEWTYGSKVRYKRNFAVAKGGLDGGI